MLRYARKGLDPDEGGDADESGSSPPQPTIPALSY